MIAIDMEMPHDCRECPMQMYYMNCGQTWCRAASRMLATDYKEISMEIRPPWCPLIDMDKYEDDGK